MVTKSKHHQIGLMIFDIVVVVWCWRDRKIEIQKEKKNFSSSHPVIIKLRELSFWALRKKKYDNRYFHQMQFIVHTLIGSASKDMTIFI